MTIMHRFALGYLEELSEKASKLINAALVPLRNTSTQPLGIVPRFMKSFVITGVHVALGSLGAVL